MRMDLSVADGRQGNDRHVEGVKGRPPLDEHIPERADGQDAPEGDQNHHDPLPEFLHWLEY